MNALRSVLFAGLVPAVLLPAGLLCLPLLLLGHSAASRYTRWGSAVILRLAELLCGVRVEVTGLERLRDGPCLIAAKHQSALETFVLCRRLTGAAFVLKRELVTVPLLGWYVAALRPIAIDRGAGPAALRALLRRAEAAVGEGRDIVIFPEGTRVPPGGTVRYRPGVAALYGALSLPVIPLALDTGRLWPRRGLVKRPGRATLAFLEPIPPGLPRHRFTALLRQRIEAGCRALEDRRAPG